jgi:hypothetical protein
MRRWIKLAVVGGTLLQFGACNVGDLLITSLENELVFSATSFAFTSAQTVFMNYLGL